MKNKLFIFAVFTLSGITFLNTSISAQNLKISVGANRSSSYMAINAGSKHTKNTLSVKGQGSSEEVIFESEKVKMSTKAMYMISEQFVFDNLNSLKSSFTTSDI